MSDTTTTFAELIKSGAISVTDGYRAKNSELKGDGLIFLRAGHVTDAHIDFEGVERFDEQLTPKLRDKTSRTGDVIVTTKGNSTGRTSFVDATMPTFVYSPHLSRWRVEDEARIDSAFLRYWSRSPQFVNQMRGLAASTDMAPYLSLRDQQRLEITLPHVARQRDIGAVLSSLDDKIEQNRRTGRALEGLARATFKAWFVDFEPVKAKAAGQTSFPGMPPATLGAIPDHLNESPLGPIPQGWTVTTLSAVADVIMGTSPPSHTYNEAGDGVPLINGPVEYGERFPLRSKWTTAQVKQSSPADLIFCVRGSTTGRRVVSDGIYGLGRGVCAIRGRDASQPFVNFLIEHDLGRLLAGTTGSVFPSLSAPSIKGFEIVRPAGAAVAAFCSFASPLIELIDSGFRENEKLAALRDYLLPRLLNGKVRAGECAAK